MVGLMLLHQIDAKAKEMLSKKLQACKRKGTTSDDPAAKKARVNTPSSIAPVNVATATEVAAVIEVDPIARVGTAIEGSMLASSMSPPVEDQAPQPPTKREEGERKKEKRVVVKVHHRACLSGFDDDDDSPREDSFSDPNLIQDLTNKFVLPKVVDQMVDLDHTQLI
ncbi:hypothetical protein COCNU_scaffold003676G000010 [Cocos nucifera]|nr:hypothetical protein [Cocos nucifera]